MENRLTFVIMTLVAFTFVNSEVRTTADPVTTTNISTATPAVSSSPTSDVVAKPNTDSVDNDTIKLVPIEVYYEANSTTSANLIKNQLIPVYTKFNKFIDLTLIPFAQGKIIISADNRTTLECGGSEECDADIVHACGIKRINNTDKLLKFVDCALTEEQKPNTTVLVESCGKNSDIDINVIPLISKCANDKDESYPLLKNYSTMSDTAKIMNVPTIILNKNYSDKSQNYSVENLTNAICKIIDGKHSLAECKGPSANGSYALVGGILPILFGVFYLINIF